MNDWETKTQLEIAHQASRASEVRDISPTPRHVLERYTKCKHWWAFPKEFVFKALGNISGLEILDFGCGTGAISNELALLGARVTGIDISPDLVGLAGKRAAMNGVQDRTEFLAIDVTKSPLPENKFDWIVCYAVLHHLDLNAVMPPLVASLKPEGRMAIVEPIAFSPTLRFIRSLLPLKMDTSPVDRQLNPYECKLISSHLEGHTLKYFDLFGRLTRFFPWRTAYKIFGAIDHTLISVFPFLARFYGEIVIIGQKGKGK